MKRPKLHRFGRSNEVNRETWHGSLTQWHQKNEIEVSTAYQYINKRFKSNHPVPCYLCKLEAKGGKR